MLDKLWGQIKGVLGGIQGEVSFGSDRPTSGSVSIGERRYCPLLVWGVVALFVFLLVRK